MSELVADCPRCGAVRITFDLVAAVDTAIRYDWQQWREAFCICRHCRLPSIFKLTDDGVEAGRYIRKLGLVEIKGAVNDVVRIEGTVTLKDKKGISPPEHVPEAISAVFAEGATCLAVECFNAAGTMFRLCIDLASKSLLPEIDRDGLNSKIRRNLGLRLPWLFEQGLLPTALSELSSCIKEDGNDGAHEGTLKKEDAEDLLDFTVALFERMYTEPERLRLAKERRDKRRNG